MHLWRGPFGERAVIVGMAESEERHVAVGDQLLPSKFTDELEQAEARLPIAILHLNDQATTDETGESVKDGRLSGCIIPAADSLRRLQRPPLDEDREPAKQALLRLREQVIAPLDGAAHRPLAFWEVGGTVRQQC